MCCLGYVPQGWQVIFGSLFVLCEIRTWDTARVFWQEAKGTPCCLCCQGQSFGRKEFSNWERGGFGKIMREPVYVYSLGLNRLRWAGRLEGHVLVAVLPITGFGRALALCPRTHPANGHPGRRTPRQKSWARHPSAARLCTFDHLRADSRGNTSLDLTCAVEIPSCHDAIGEGAVRLSSPGQGHLQPAAPLSLSAGAS